jgi:DNA-binding MarR family transcriptional regulator
MGPQAASPGQDASGCPGTGLKDLAQMDDSQRRRVLVAGSARFAVAFLRWMDSRACGRLTYPRLRLLEALHTGGPAKMADLAAQLGISARNMTALVDALEEARLVVRRPHPGDRRATLIDLTPGGTGAAETTLGPGLDAMSELFDRLSLEDQQHYLKVLDQLLDAMDGSAAGLQDGSPAGSQDGLPGRRRRLVSPDSDPQPP